MKNLLILLLAFSFCIIYGKSHENKDELFINFVYNYSFQKNTIENFENKVKEYKGLIGTKPNKEQQIYYFYSLLVYNNYLHNYDYGEKLSNKLLAMIGDHKKYPNITSEIYYSKSINCSVFGTNPEAMMVWLKRSIKIAKDAKLYRALSRSYLYYSQIEQASDDLKSSLYHLDVAVKYLYKYDNKENFVIYKLLRFQLLLEIYMATHEKKWYDASENILNEIVSHKNNDNTYKSEAYVLKAYLQILQKKYVESLMNMQKAASFKNYDKHQLFADSNLKNQILAVTHYNLNNKKKANLYLKKVDINIPSYFSPNVLYSNLYLIEEEKGNFKNALEFHKKFAERKIKNDYIKFKIGTIDFEKKYKLSQKNLQIIQLQEKQKTLYLSLIITLNILFIASLFTFFYFRKKKQKRVRLEYKIKQFMNTEVYKIQYAKEEAVNKLKQEFAIQLHNNIGNTIIAASSFLKAKKNLESNNTDLKLWELLIENLNEIYQVVRSKSHSIYNSSLDNKSFFNEIEKNIHIILSGKTVNLVTNFNISEELIISPQIKLCFLHLIKEGCTNIVKYSKSKNVVINIDINTEELFVEVKDFENYLPVKEKSYSFGFGLSNLKKLVEESMGTFNCYKDKNGFLISAVFFN